MRDCVVSVAFNSRINPQPIWQSNWDSLAQRLCHGGGWKEEEKEGWMIQAASNCSRENQTSLPFSTRTNVRGLDAKWRDLKSNHTVSEWPMYHECPSYWMFKGRRTLHQARRQSEANWHIKAGAPTHDHLFRTDDDVDGDCDGGGVQQFMTVAFAVPIAPRWPLLLKNYSKLLVRPDSSDI